MLVRVFTSGRQARETWNVLLNRPEGGKRECYNSIGRSLLVCGWRNCPLNLFMRDLKQNEKDQAHLEADDVIEV